MRNVGLVVALVGLAMVMLAGGCASDKSRPLANVRNISIYLSISDILFLDVDWVSTMNPTLFEDLLSDNTRALDRAIASSLGQIIVFDRIKSIRDYLFIMKFDDDPVKALQKALQEDHEAVRVQLGLEPDLLIGLEVAQEDKGFWSDFSEELVQGIEADAVLLIHGQYHVSRDQPAFVVFEGKLIGLQLEWQAVLLDKNGREIWSAYFSQNAPQSLDFGHWEATESEPSLLPPVVVHTASLVLDEGAVVRYSRRWAPLLADEVMSSLADRITGAKTDTGP